MTDNSKESLTNQRNVFEKELVDLINKEFNAGNLTTAHKLKRKLKKWIKDGRPLIKKVGVANA